MNLLFALFVAVAALSGCMTRSQVKGIVDEAIAGKLDKKDTPNLNRFATNEDLKNLEKKLTEQRNHAIKYHKRNWPHGCEDHK